MKKIYLARVQQYNTVSYTGSVDPRKLVKMADQTIEIGQVRDDQRPLDKKHILEIAEHVATKTEDGLLPTSVIVGTKEKDKLVVETEKSSTGETLYFMMIPDTEEELIEYANTIDISDGQHRVFAFSDAYRNPDLKDSVIYEIPVTFFITPMLRTRQSIFYTTNAKQKQVSPNLLMWLRQKLELLSKTEAAYFPIVQALNTENISPLKGRIIMSAEPISKGYKAKELIKIFNKAKLSDIALMIPGGLTETKVVQMISDYLNGWEQKYNLSFQHPKYDTMTKISGLRYILLLLPTFVELSVSKKCKFEPKYVVEMITELEETKNILQPSDDTLFSIDPLSFRGEGGTVKLAEDDAKTLKAYDAQKETQGFNPFA